MENLLTEQINILLTEMDGIPDLYHRASIRSHLIKALSTIVGTVEETSTGKEAIKNDIAKEPIEEIVEEIKIEVPAQEEQLSDEPNEIDLDPTIEEEQEIVMATIESENGSSVEIDITEAFNSINDYVGEEIDKKTLASDITEYALLPIMNELTSLTSNKSKMMLAYYLQQFGLEEINEAVNGLTDNRFNNVYEFANDENIEALVSYIESLIPDEE